MKQNLNKTCPEVRAHCARDIGVTVLLNFYNTCIILILILDTNNNKNQSSDSLSGDDQPPPSDDDDYEEESDSETDIDDVSSTDD